MIFEAADGSWLLEKLGETQPDILLMDLELPDINGPELLPIVHERYPKIKVIVLSMHSQPRMMARMMALGASAYLNKNVQKSLLQQTLIEVYEKGHSFTEDVSMALTHRLRSMNDHQPTWEMDSETEQRSNFLFIKKGKELKKVLFKDIVYLEVEERYVDIYTVHEKFVIMISLKKILHLLDSRFHQTHRNHVVNIDYIEKIIPGDNLIHLSGGHHAILSGKYKDLLKQTITLK